MNDSCGVFNLQSQCRDTTPQNVGYPRKLCTWPWRPRGAWDTAFLAAVVSYWEGLSRRTKVTS